MSHQHEFANVRSGDRNDGVGSNLTSANVRFAQVAVVRSLMSLVCKAWPHQGATGAVVIDIGAQRIEIEISVPVARTIDIGFVHHGADPLESMVFFRAGLIDFVFCSMSLGRTIMSGSISPWPVVKNGANGHPIKTLQYLLRARGHSVVVDGVFGPNTEAAVKAFQAGNGLAADGIVGPVNVGGSCRAGQKGKPGRRGQRGAGGVPIPQPVRRSQQWAPSRWDLRTSDGRCGAWFSASPFAGHPFRKSRRNRWSGYLAGPGEWHAFFLAAASR